MDMILGKPNVAMKPQLTSLQVVVQQLLKDFG